jgi:hypothetical protein
MLSDLPQCVFPDWCYLLNEADKDFVHNFFVGSFSV